MDLVLLQQQLPAATLLAAGAGIVGCIVILAVQVLTNADPIGRCYVFWKQLGAHETRLSCSDSVHKAADDYSALHRKASAEDRTTNYKALVNSYYDLATVFYEWGWGQSFHFSLQYPHETFYESIRRHEYLLAVQLRVFGKDARVLDVGCGIGGPMRNIAKFLQCRVTGITLNPYQVARGNELTAADALVRNTCKSVQGDFMHLPFAGQNESLFDAAYAIEATCHAPDRVGCYREVYDSLKPGAIFACYEWCMTDKYDPADAEHLRLKKDIEEGNGLPDIITTAACLQALRDAGFEVVKEQDLATEASEMPGSGVQAWMTPLQPSWNPLSQRFQFNWLGGRLTNAAVAFLELVRIAPAGTKKTQQILQRGGFALRDAGEAQIFTTMYLMVGRKPIK